MSHITDCFDTNFTDQDYSNAGQMSKFQGSPGFSGVKEPIITINKFSDILVEANGTNKVIPFPKGEKVIYKGYTEAPKGTRFLGWPSKHGRLYATEEAYQNFPRQEGDVIVGACMVVFILDFVVLVKTNNRSFLTNPCGYCEQGGETTWVAAFREVKEETGINLKGNDFKSLATWKFDTKYANLDLIAQTFGFYTLIECPKEWNLKDDINRIEFDDKMNETEYILVVKVDKLHEVNINGLHLNLIREAYRRLNPLPYLKYFKFREE